MIALGWAISHLDKDLLPNLFEEHFALMGLIEEEIDREYMTTLISHFDLYPLSSYLSIWS